MAPFTRGWNGWEAVVCVCLSSLLGPKTMLADVFFGAMALLLPHTALIMQAPQDWITSC